MQLLQTEQEPDERLMARVAQGNRDSLDILLRRYASSLLTFIRRMVGDRHRSEELFQEVFLAVWRQSRQYQYPRSFKSWLFGIAVNKCRGHLRSQMFWHGRLDGEPVADLPGADDSPPEAAAAAERARLVAEAVSRLPVTQRMVLVLRVWNGLTYAEIAQTMDRTEATVRSNMFHALGTLRRYLEPKLK